MSYYKPEVKGYVYAYVDLIWSNLFRIAQLNADNDVVRAYNLLLNIIPLLPSDVSAKAMDYVSERIIKLNLKCNMKLSDAFIDNILKSKEVRYELRNLIINALKIISNELERLGYKARVENIRVGGEIGE